MALQQNHRGMSCMSYEDDILQGVAKLHEHVSMLLKQAQQEKAAQKNLQQQIEDLQGELAYAWDIISGMEYNPNFSWATDQL